MSPGNAPMIEIDHQNYGSNEGADSSVERAIMSVESSRSRDQIPQRRYSSNDQRNDISDGPAIGKAVTRQDY